ncbi:MAG: tRNA (cytidine(34)-2'-O)-methyltransferase [Pseudomonadota bacterium]
MICLALYQPDIPQNAGTILRMGACLGVPVHIIEPAGFVWSDRSLKRAGMDYLDHADIARHDSFDAFLQACAGRRMVLLTTRSDVPYTEFAFRDGDILLLGRESAGVPDKVHRIADGCVRIPMQAGVRSLNVAVSAALVLGEALRQSGGFPS